MEGAALQALGLASVRYFSQLLPLLLEWLHANGIETRVLAAKVSPSGMSPVLGRLCMGARGALCISWFSSALQMAVQLVNMASKRMLKYAITGMQIFCPQLSCGS